MGYIYKITCDVNGKVYVGQTTGTVQDRWKQHKRDAKYNKAYLEGNITAPRSKRGTCSKLYCAINKHGPDNFRIEVIAEADELLLDSIETEEIAKHNSVALGYNLKAGGNRSSHSEETKAKMKEINSTNMQTTFVQFRKHGELLKDLPIHCIHIRKRDIEGVAIHKHPLCSHKEFMVNKHGTIDGAKQALLEHLAHLEATGVPAAKFVKKDTDLPKGIRRVKNSYFVDKTINGKTHRKSFSKLSDDENKQNAIDFLNSLLI